MPFLLPAEEVLVYLSLINKKKNSSPFSLSHIFHFRAHLARTSARELRASVRFLSHEVY